MANNIQLNAGSGGSVLAAEQNPGGSSEQYQLVKIVDGTAGAFTNRAAVSSNGLKVDPSGVNVTVVSVDGGQTSLGSTTDANTASTVIGRLKKLVSQLPAALGQAAMASSLPVVVASDQSTLPVSAASLPLPTGAATSAKQPALGTAGTASADVLSVQGVASMTPLKVDGSGVTQPVSGTLTANIGTSGSLALDATLSGGSQQTQVVPGTATGYTVGTLVAAASNNLTTVKASAGTLGYLSASNNAAYPLYVKAFNGNPTMGTTACVAQWEIPCNGTAANGAGRECALPPQGLKFSSGIYLAITKGISPTDNTVVAASDGLVTYGYQ